MKYCLIYVIVLSIVIFLIGRIYPRKWIKENAFPFTSFKFEKNGKVYEKIKIKKWKTVFPDFSYLITKILPNFMPRKRIDKDPKTKIPVLIKESCVAESTHFIAIILGLFCITIYPKLGGIITYIVYALLNVPPILIQRYNRPRLKTALSIYSKEKV